MWDSLSHLDNLLLRGDKFSRARRPWAPGRAQILTRTKKDVQLALKGYAYDCGMVRL